MKHNIKFPEADYFRDYLRGHLRDHHFSQASDENFINLRADSAYNALTGYRLEGRRVDTAQELAMRVLLDGLYVSRWDVIMQVIEEDLWLRIPSEKRLEWAEMFLSLRFINRILDEYEVNGDFLQRSEYPSLRAKLLGEMTEILDGYGRV
ncbi:MAG: DUF1896 domain-containing protein [Muribaculaceae bacterium]